MDNLELLTLDEVPEALRAIAMFEKCGSMTPEAATEWRLRIAAWTRYLQLGLTSVVH